MQYPLHVMQLIGIIVCVESLSLPCFALSLRLFQFSQPPNPQAGKCLHGTSLVPAFHCLPVLGVISHPDPTLCCIHTPAGECRSQHQRQPVLHLHSGDTLVEQQARCIWRGEWSHVAHTACICGLTLCLQALLHMTLQCCTNIRTWPNTQMTGTSWICSRC